MRKVLTFLKNLLCLLDYHTEGHIKALYTPKFMPIIDKIWLHFNIYYHALP
jgi:hypothetical protein